jgi:hypothetical protein
MDAKALAMELLNILEAKQASQAQNPIPCGCFGARNAGFYVIEYP